MTQQPAPALFAEFEACGYEEWLAAALKSLNGAPFERLIKRSYEGIEIQPLAHSADLTGLAHLDTRPGKFPYVRGTSAAGYRAQPWLIAQEFAGDEPSKLNQNLRQALSSGQTAICLDDSASRYQASDLSTAFAGIDLSRIPLFTPATADPAAFYRRLSTWLNPPALKQLRGCIGYDPLHRLAQFGSLPAEPFAPMAAYVQLVAEQSPQLAAIAVRTDAYHDSGCSAVQEMAIATATAAAYLREMTERGLPIDAAAGKLCFFMRIGENFFIELAKFRAVKLLWAQVVQAFGGSPQSQKITLHASSGTRNKTQHDPYVNLLRTTTEALSAAIGGIDGMQISPFDAPLGAPTDFAQRIARNQQLILQQEVKLINLIDAAGGAWLIEKLTDQLAQAAWQQFQQIEAQGGMLAALCSGSIQRQIAAIAEQRRQDVEHRRTVLVGSNRYASLAESPPPVPRSQQHSSPAPTAAACLRAQPLPAIRLAQPFEELRRHAENHRRRTGQLPRIFLANFGQLSEYQARMDFARSFFEAGGFECIDGGGHSSAAAALLATQNSAAAAVVICASDAGCRAFVPEYVPALKAQPGGITVILAAKPQDSYRRAGVDDFAHRSANCYALNRTLQEKLKVGR